MWTKVKKNLLLAKIFIFIFLFFIPLKNSLAVVDYVAMSLGPMFATDSDEVNDSNVAIFRYDKGGTLLGNIEKEIIPFLYFAGSLGVSFFKAKLEYDNKDLMASNVDVNVSEAILQLGLRLRFFPESSFSLFLGGGGLAASFEISYDNSQIDAQNPNSNTGYKKHESSNLIGFYYELGIELINQDNYGLRLQWQRQEREVSKIEGLNDRRVKNNADLYLIGLVKRF